MTKKQPENGVEKESKNKQDIDETPDTLNLIELKKKDINSLIKIARSFNIENATCAYQFRTACGHQFTI